MKRLQVVFLFVLLMGCSSGPSVVPTVTSGIVQVPSLAPTETAILPTQTLAPAPTFTPPPNVTAIGGGAGKIAFVSERDGVPEIYVINADGSNLTKLANEITPKSGASWSPDGRKIAFATSDADFASLYIMNADGSDPVKLIDTEDIDVYDQATPDLRFVTGCCSASWSPDGTKIAFKVARYIGCCFTAGYVHVLNADGSYLSSIEIPVWEGPVWSPDNQKIVFGADCGDKGGICVMNADGTNPTHLASGGSPSWSPDGKRIAFSSSRNGTSDIYVMNADGTDPINLTNNNNASDGSPIWSPDGKKIAFNSVSIVDTSDISVINADGTNPIRLTNHERSNWNPVWSPDSTKIAFVSERDGNSELYIVDADGNNLVRLTENVANDYSPVWSP